MLLFGFSPTSQSVVQEMHISALKRSHKIKEKKKSRTGNCLHSGKAYNFSLLKVLENTSKSEISNSSAKSLNTLCFSISWTLHKSINLPEFWFPHPKGGLVGYISVCQLEVLDYTAHKVMIFTFSSISHKQAKNMTIHFLEVLRTTNSISKNWNKYLIN